MAAAQRTRQKVPGAAADLIHVQALIGWRFVQGVAFRSSPPRRWAAASKINRTSDTRVEDAVTGDSSAACQRDEAMMCASGTISACRWIAAHVSDR